MRDLGYHQPTPYRKPTGVVTVTGQGVSVRVRRGMLHIEDGFPLEAPRRVRALSRAVDRVDRIVFLAGSGQVTVAGLDWCTANGVPILGCDQAGRLRWTLLPGPGGQWRFTLRRAQALAAFCEVGLDIAKRLVTQKTQRQQALLRAHPLFRDVEFPSDADSEQTLALIQHAASIERLRFLESRVSERYWSRWIGLRPRFRPASWIVAAHWTFTSRHSPLSGGPKNAVDPINACLNLGYSLLAAETLIACHGAGLDPGLAVLHADRDARLSFVYDLMEPTRPAVDRLVLDLVRDHEFRRGELWSLRDGSCRLDQDLAATLCAKWMPLLRREVAPVVERVASWLRRARITRREHPAHRVVPKASIGVCPECGSPVRPGGRFCSAACYQVWWRANVQRRVSAQGNERLGLLRSEGRDPAHGGEAGRKRAATTSRVKRAEWMRLTPEERRQRTRPASQARWSHRGNTRGGDPMKDR